MDLALMRDFCTTPIAPINLISKAQLLLTILCTHGRTLGHVSQQSHLSVENILKLKSLSFRSSVIYEQIG